jgi:hypothetical protein
MQLSGVSGRRFVSSLEVMRMFDVVDAGSEQSRQVPRPAYVQILRQAVTLRVAVGTAVVVGLGLAVIAASYASTFDPPEESWLTFGVRQIGAGLLVVAIVNVVLQIFIERYRQQLSGGLESFLREDITNDLRQIRADIEQQANVLLDGSTTLAALGTAGVSEATHPGPKRPKPSNTTWRLLASGRSASWVSRSTTSYEAISMRIFTQCGG